jgi:hypothetical protein
MGALETLIKIYASHPTANVASDPEYVALCEANHDNAFFHKERHRVEALKTKLEGQVAIQQTRQKQVKYALRIFERLVGSENQLDEICLRLIRGAYYPDWTEKQRSYFDKISEILETCEDYFLSFTQRNSGGGMGNPINGIHRYLIQSYGLPDPKDSASNELARMLDLVLRTSRYDFRGFFFPAHEDDSAQVNQKLKNALERSLVFIQLVQNEMFSTHYDSGKNYCYQEYSMACGLQKKMIYLFANGQHPDDLIPEDAAHFELDSWYQYVLGADCVAFDPTVVSDQSANIPVNRAKLKDRLVESVQKVREALWNDAPGDLD